jgi:hypothetical protein
MGGEGHVTFSGAFVLVLVVARLDRKLYPREEDFQCAVGSL